METKGVRTEQKTQPNLVSGRIFVRIQHTDFSVTMSPQIVYESNIITNISCFDHNSHLESTSTSNIRHHSTDSTHCPYTYWGTCSAPMCQFIISCHKAVMIGNTLEHSLEHEIFKKLDPCQYQGEKTQSYY